MKKISKIINFFGHWRYVPRNIRTVSEKWIYEKMTVEKKGHGKNGRKKGREKKSRRRKWEKNNNTKSHFSTTAEILVRIFFALIGFNLWTNFIGIIWLDKLLKLLRATTVYHSEGADLIWFQSMFGWVFNTNEQWGMKGRGLFILRLFFP